MATVLCSSFLSVRSCPRSTQPGRRASRTPRLAVHAAFRLVDSQGQATPYNKPQCTAGSAPGCDVPLRGPQVAPQHAHIIQKGRQTFLKPLVGESMLDDSRCWKDGVALRPGVMYVLASGSELAFGTEGQSFTIEFEEGSASNPLMEMMMKGMLANSSPDVKKALGGL